MELFWDMTPKEFHFVFEAWQNDREYHIQSDWEQTRMIIYYQYCSIAKKGRNPSYQKFKLDHIPFPWDRINKKEVELDEEPTEQPVSPAEWMERITKLKPGTVAADVEEIKG